VVAYLLSKQASINMEDKMALYDCPPLSCSSWLTVYKIATRLSLELSSRRLIRSIDYGPQGAIRSISR
jgi:hypothetical protein